MRVFPVFGGSLHDYYGVHRARRPSNKYFLAEFLRREPRSNDWGSRWKLIQRSVCVDEKERFGLDDFGRGIRLLLSPTIVCFWVPFEFEHVRGIPSYDYTTISYRFVRQRTLVRTQLIHGR